MGMRRAERRDGFFGDARPPPHERWERGTGAGGSEKPPTDPHETAKAGTKEFSGEFKLWGISRRAQGRAVNEVKVTK